MCKDEEKESNISKNATDEYERSEMVHEHVKKEVLFLGRDFHLNDAIFSGDNSEMERKKIQGKRKGRGKTGKEKEEDRKSSLNLSAWIAKTIHSTTQGVKKPAARQTRKETGIGNWS